MRYIVLHVLPKPELRFIYANLLKEELYSCKKVAKRLVVNNPSLNGPPNRGGLNLTLANKLDVPSQNI